jgi:hypothetical protein
MFDNILCSNALAYMDPGTGSWIIQTLIAGFVGAAFAIKMFWHTIAAKIARLFGKKPDEQDDGQQ